MPSALLLSTPTLPLYHYTTADALPKILQSRTLWATSVHCLNDTEEYRYGFALARDLCAQGEVIPPHLGRAILESLDGPYAGVEMQSQFVTSFSEAPDLLSQWRAYGGKGPAFSIGFTPDRVQAIADRNHCSVVKCLYTREEQAALLRTLLERLLASSELDLQGQPEGFVVPGFGNAFVASLIDLAVMFKHPAFAEEQEWRLVTHSLPSAGPHVRFRAGASLLIPYLELRLASPHERLPISSAVVGPTAQPELSRMSLLDALASHNCLATADTVTNSLAPFRGWW